MSEVFRICPECGGSVALSQKHCGACGYDGSSGQPLARRSLPATVVQAALPVVAGLTTLALRSGWRFVRKQLEARTMSGAEESPAPVVKAQPATAPPRRVSGRRIHIRSSWVVGDAAGNWQKGHAEHTIEIDD